MTSLAVSARERLVGNVADEVLQESVLPALGRAAVGIETEHLLADEALQYRFELLRGRAGDRFESSENEGLAEDGGIPHEAPLVVGQLVEP